MSTSTHKPVAYICGKVTGEPIAQCTMKFGGAQKKLEADGYHVLNPLEVVGDFHLSWEQAMKLCIAALLTADVVVLLPDWRQSRGALLEVNLAKELKITCCEL